MKHLGMIEFPLMMKEMALCLPLITGKISVQSLGLVYRIQLKLFECDWLGMADSKMGQRPAEELIK